MNAIDLLKEDHKVVSNLFDQVKSTPASKHRALFKKIKAELDTHALIEETVFYPRLKKDGKKDLVDITLEGIEEHRQIKMFLRAIAEMKRVDDEFEAKLKVLMEDVEHHVKEEEDEMFPQVEDQFSKTALERLGNSLENKKQKYLTANPDVARNLANRKAMRKQGILGAMLEKAMTVAGEILKATGAGNGRTTVGKGSDNGRSRSVNGKSKPTPKAAKSTIKKNTSKKTTGKSPGGRRSAAR